MRPFDVYPLYDIEIARGEGAWLFDSRGRRYLDFYGGHAVVSIGHGHAKYVDAIARQIERLGFYSNVVVNPVQLELAERLGRVSGYPDYHLFLCNCGAEANENALKLAAIRTGRPEVLAFSEAFHGRTAGAAAVTDNPSLRAPGAAADHVRFSPMNDIAAAELAFRERSVGAVIVEGVQGIAGIVEAEDEFLRALRRLCDDSGAMLILDEVQSGCGRTGTYFAHQRSGVRPDLITVAKGMGNGFPVAGVLIHPDFEAKHGMLGTTFGGNHLACAAACAVLETIEEEGLVERAGRIGTRLAAGLRGVPGVKEVRGRGLMLGVSLDRDAAAVRNTLLRERGIFTGSAHRKDTIRLLPPLVIREEQTELFLSALSDTLLQPIPEALPA